MSENLNNGYSICPNSWLFDERIGNMLRLLLLISSLSAKEGYCYANNDYLAEKLGKSTDTISGQISKLKEYGYIEVEEKRFGAVITHRKIRLIALENLNQLPTENSPSANGGNQNRRPPTEKMPSANGKNSVANGKNAVRYNRWNITSLKNTNQENYKPLAHTHTDERTDTHAKEQASIDENFMPEAFLSEIENFSDGLNFNSSENLNERANFNNQQNLNTSPKRENLLNKLPTWLDERLWQAFLEHKVQKGQRLSVISADRLVNQVWAKWHKQGVDVNARIEACIIGGYSNVFLEKNQNFEPQANKTFDSVSSMKNIKDATPYDDPRYYETYVLGRW